LGILKRHASTVSQSYIYIYIHRRDAENAENGKTEDAVEKRVESKAGLTLAKDGLIIA